MALLDLVAKTTGKHTAADPADEREPLIQRLLGRNPALGQGWVAGRSWVLAGAFWLVVVIVLVVGIQGMTRHTKTPPPPTPPPSSVGPSGWAQLFVQAYLSAGVDDSQQVLGQFMANPPELNNVHDNTFEAVGSPIAVSAEQTTTPGYWAVTVAANVSAANGNQWTPPTVRFYDVDVYTHNGSYVSQTLPEEVPAPPRAAVSPQIDFNGADAPMATNPQDQTITQFLSALLTGNGQLNRYTPAGSTLQPISPPPFTTVQVNTLTKTAAPAHSNAATGGGPKPTEWVLADVNATDQYGNTTELTYTLGLVDIARQWDVTEILPATPLQHNQQTSTARSNS